MLFWRHLLNATLNCVKPKISWRRWNWRILTQLIPQTPLQTHLRSTAQQSSSDIHLRRRHGGRPILVTFRCRGQVRWLTYGERWSPSPAVDSANFCHRSDGGYSYDSSSIRWRSGRRSTPIRLQFDRAASLWPLDDRRPTCACAHCG